MEIGTAVEHRVYGKGIIMAARHGGFEYRVEFDFGIELWTPASRLILLGKPHKAFQGARNSNQKPPQSRGAQIYDSRDRPNSPDLSTPTPAPTPASTPASTPAPTRTNIPANIKRGPSNNIQTSIPSDLPSVSCDCDKFVARQMIESMRMGVVSENHATRFTLGREDVLKDICKRLCASERLPLVVSGEYGSGKTHVLDYLYGVIGTLHGFAVARCSLDVNEVGLHQPKNIYKELVKTFRFIEPGGSRAIDFRSFLKLRGVHSALRNHSYFGCIDSNCIEHEVLHWITGQEDSNRPWVRIGRGYRNLPPLYPYQNAANIYTNLLSGLSYACKEVGGRGLVLLFDEAEFLKGPYTSYQLARGRNFLNALVRCVKEDEYISEMPLQTGLAYSLRAEKTPFLFHRDCDLNLIFAFADPAIANESEQLHSAHRIFLGPLNSDSYDSALVRVKALYDEAYGIKITMNDGDSRRRQEHLRGLTYSPRLFFKGCVEILDLARARLQHSTAL